MVSLRCGAYGKFAMAYLECNIVSSEESFGSSSDDDSILWTEEFDEELDFISVMMDEDDIALVA